MTRVFRAHFDGKVIIPDEPVELPLGEPFDLEFRPRAFVGRDSGDQCEQALARLLGRRIRGLSIPDEALRREHLYEERA